MKRNISEYLRTRFQGGHPAKRAVFITVIVLVFLAALGGAAFAGYQYGFSHSIRITDSKQLLDSNFNLFWEAVDIAKSKFVDASQVSDEKLMQGAIKGMLSAFDDPYTTYFNASDAKKFQDDLNGSFGGIGAEIGIREEQLVVVSPIKGNPAEAVGLRPMDRIWKIDGKDTTGLAVEEAVKLIRGEPGTTVTLSIYRDGWRDAKDFKIVRAIIQVPTLDSEVKTLSSGQKVAVMKLYNFNANVPQLFYTSAVKAMQEGANGIVLDLRSNPGGFLDVATNLGGWLLKDGSVVVRERKHSGPDEVLEAHGNAALADIPMVVLINSGSASASEILAGALRDIRGIKLIGEKSFGKGSVQELTTMSDQAEIKVTIAHWYTPKGTKIDKLGLKPDIEVKMTDEDYTKKRDPQMDKALQVLDAELLAKK